MTKFETTAQLFAALRADLLTTVNVAKGDKKVNLMNEEQIDKFCQKPIYTYNQHGLAIKRSILHEGMSAYNAMTKDETKRKDSKAWIAYACDIALKEIKRMSVYPSLDHILDEYEATQTKQLLGYKLVDNFAGDFIRYATAMIAVLQNANTLLQACTTVKNLSGKLAIRNDKAQGIVSNTGNANTSLHKQIALDLTYGLPSDLTTIGDPIEFFRYGITINVQAGGTARISWLETGKHGNILDHSHVFNGNGFAKRSQVVTWVTTQLRKAKFTPTESPSEVSELPTNDQPDAINPTLPATVESGIADRQASRKNPANKK